MLATTQKHSKRQAQLARGGQPRTNADRDKQQEAPTEMTNKNRQPETEAARGKTLKHIEKETSMEIWARLVTDIHTEIQPARHGNIYDEG